MKDDIVYPRRGRPLGTSAYADKDRQTLNRVADLIYRDPRQTPTAAIKQAIGTTPTESHIRRIRRKLNENWAQLMDEARSRSQVKAPEILDNHLVPTLGNGLIMLGQAANKFEVWYRGPKGHALRAKLSDMVLRADAYLKTPEGQKLLENLSMLVDQGRPNARRQARLA